MAILNLIATYCSNAVSFLGASGTAFTVLTILWTIAKRVSNDKAGPIVSKIQAGFDAVASFIGVIIKALTSFVALLQKVSQMLKSLVQSDGVLGVK